LMAADILVYKATHVPVGDDQKQHLELTRDIAIAFNSMFETELFPAPEPLIQKTAARVMSLRDGTSKMSKSDTSDATRINLTDSADEISRKIKKAKTDPEPLPETIDLLEERAEARNLVGIYAGLAGCTAEDVLAEFGGKGFGEFKPRLAELAVEVIAPISAEMNRLLDDHAAIDSVLAKGAEQAAALSAPVLAEVKSVMGLGG